MLDDEAWARAQQAAKANGITTVTGLCYFLLHREIEHEPVKPTRKKRTARKVVKAKAPPVKGRAKP